jgi:hypothetical protein
MVRDSGLQNGIIGEQADRDDLRVVLQEEMAEPLEHLLSRRLEFDMHELFPAGQQSDLRTGSQAC